MNKEDIQGLVLSTTKPNDKVARALTELGIRVLPLPEDEGNVDRYIISKRLVIERRTGAGLIKGIMDKTLFTSAIYMREHFRMQMMIVEGKVNYEYSMMDPQAVRGALSSMVLQYGINVLSTPDLEETIQLIAMVLHQEQTGIPAISLIPKRKATMIDDMQRRVIEMLPGCGMVMARDLLQRFGSVQRIVNASPEELLSMRGIGRRKAHQIHKVLNAVYESVDTEKNIEDAIEADPSLLFRAPITLLARQHVIFTKERERHAVDLVFLDERRKELILVELKLGVLTGAAIDQISRYLDNAYKSTLLRTYLDQGFKLRGMLATIEKSDINVARSDVTVRVIDRRRVIKGLLALRNDGVSKTVSSKRQ
ncbi:MAG: helix-hairpin-helix domain-containing protein [Pseudomonadales bacterium]|jgi:ERCC4-type nuclease|nr:helix-hairpin-helix domain-containing protein [Pseudomonadales bacterium]|tara:strand:+ start:322 stop:1419 length:1098 start_codon:yes stop_codon:yes gene_type:complete